MGEDDKGGRIIFSDGTEAKVEPLEYIAADYSNGEAMTVVPIIKINRAAEEIIASCSISTYDMLIILGYPNRRVIWLALLHHSERVRKKNMNRMRRWYHSNYGKTKLEV